MSKCKHSPGPWVLDSETHERYTYVLSNGLDVARLDSDSEVRMANARLIAASPQLLQSLRWILDGVEKGKPSDDLNKWVADTVRSAIFKATGGGK